jgi:HD-like signal output (HDOD) protein
VVNVFREFEGDDRIRPDLDRINRRSLSIGALAKAIASSEGFAADTVSRACCAGVLSHIGILPVLIELPARWAEAIDIVERDGGPMPEAERQAYGTDHAEIGGYILGIWGFNAEIVDAVRYHHAPAASRNPAPGALTAVHVAQFLVRRDRDSYCGGAGLDMAYLERVGLVDRLPHWEATLRELSDGTFAS